MIGICYVNDRYLHDHAPMWNWMIKNTHDHLSSVVILGCSSKPISFLRGAILYTQRQTVSNMTVFCMFVQIIALRKTTVCYHLQKVLLCMVFKTIIVSTCATSP